MTNRDVLEHIDTLAAQMVADIADVDLDQLNDALAIALIHPHHINRTSFRPSPDDLRRFITIAIRHLLHMAYDQTKNLDWIRDMVNSRLRTMLSQHNPTVLTERMRRMSETHDEPEWKEIAA